MLGGGGGAAYATGRRKWGRSLQCVKCMPSNKVRHPRHWTNHILTRRDMENEKIPQLLTSQTPHVAAMIL
jgi:hypothetical protein